MNDKANGAAVPLDCTTPLDALLELTVGVGSEEAIIDDYVLTTAPTWSRPRFGWPPLFNQFAHGPIAHLMPEKVYAFTSVATAEDVPELGQLSTLYGTFIVGPRMKAVIDAFNIPKSELCPIGMVLRDKDVRDAVPGDNYERLGGGAVVEGRHWLWHVYNRHELVDWEKSEQEPYWIERPRDDLPGSPVQRFSVVNNDEKTVIYPPSYSESPVFQILATNVSLSLRLLLMRWPMRVCCCSATASATRLPHCMPIILINNAGYPVTGLIHCHRSGSSAPTCWQKIIS